MKYDIIDPFEEISNFRKEMDKFMDDFWADDNLMKGVKQPSVDIENKKNELEITADLPGIDKKDIEINLEEDKVEIKANKKKESEVKKKNFYKQERSFSGFYRAFALPAPVDPDKAKSSFSNGTLKITLPKIKKLPKKSRKLLIK